jgi:hypothetical protein
MILYVHIIYHFEAIAINFLNIGIAKRTLLSGGCGCLKKLDAPKQKHFFMCYGPFVEHRRSVWYFGPYK